MPTRFAVTTILLCLAILLLSACGWNVQAAPPIVAPTDFALWQNSSSGVMQQLIGFGSAAGTTFNVNVKIYLFNPPCAQFQLIAVNMQATGSGPTKQLRVISPAGWLQDFRLTGSLNQSSTHAWNLEFPRQFTFVPPAGCGPGGALNAEARNDVAVTRSWRGPVTQEQAAGRADSLVLRMLQANAGAGHPGLQWGEIRMYQNHCWKGLMMEVPAYAPFPAVRAFTALDGSTLDVEGLPDDLGSNSPAPLALKLKFSGGACDGNTATATLIR